MRSLCLQVCDLAALLASIAFVLVVPQFYGPRLCVSRWLAKLAEYRAPPAHQLEFWTQLSHRQSIAARELGYDRHSWDEGAAPDSIRDAAWDELTDAQRRAARVLHYTESSWNEEKKLDMAERKAYAQALAEEETEALHLQYMAELQVMLKQAQMLDTRDRS